MKRREVLLGRSDSVTFHNDFPSRDSEIFRLGKLGNSGAVRELGRRTALAIGSPSPAESKSQKMVGMTSEGVSWSPFPLRGKVSKRRVMTIDFGTEVERSGRVISLFLAKVSILTVRHGQANFAK